VLSADWCALGAAFLVRRRREGGGEGGNEETESVLHAPRPVARHIHTYIHTYRHVRVCVCVCVCVCVYTRIAHASAGRKTKQHVHAALGPRMREPCVRARSGSPLLGWSLGGGALFRGRRPGTPPSPCRTHPSLRCAHTARRERGAHFAQRRAALSCALARAEGSVCMRTGRARAPSPTLSPTDPVPRGQLWPTGSVGAGHRVSRR